MEYDYLIVGAGLFGSVFAREMTDAGAKCLVIEKRNHIGGNCFTDNIKGINVHMYGPHIFHTNNIEIWNYLNKYSTINNYRYIVKAIYKNDIYSFPINLFTLYQLWNVKTPNEARIKLESVRIKNNNPKNFEEWILSKTGEEIYYKFFYGYTKKQWGIEPKNLPVSIIKRIPIRLTFDDNYHFDKFQGIPENGYTKIFENLLKNIPVILNTDFLENKNYFELKAKKIIYTGAIDEFFDYIYGPLKWRSLKFEHKILKQEYYQGCVTINYTDYEIPFTRIVEHKHFNNLLNETDFTIITEEYPQKWDKNEERFYPINNDENNELYQKYKSLIDNSKYIFGGRLANYCYYDMHQVIENALNKSKSEIKYS